MAAQDSGMEGLENNMAVQTTDNRDARMGCLFMECFFIAEVGTEVFFVLPA